MSFHSSFIFKEFIEKEFTHLEFSFANSISQLKYLTIFSFLYRVSHCLMCCVSHQVISSANFCIALNAPVSGRSLQLGVSSVESNWLGDHVRLAFRLGEVNVGN